MAADGRRVEPGDSGAQSRVLTVGSKGNDALFRPVRRFTTSDEIQAIQLETIDFGNSSKNMSNEKKL